MQILVKIDLILGDSFIHSDSITNKNEIFGTLYLSLKNEALLNDSKLFPSHFIVVLNPIHFLCRFLCLFHFISSNKVLRLHLTTFRFRFRSLNYLIKTCIDFYQNQATLNLVKQNIFFYAC